MPATIGALILAEIGVADAAVFGGIQLSAIIGNTPIAGAAISMRALRKLPSGDR